MYRNEKRKIKPYSKVYQRKKQKESLKKIVAQYNRKEDDTMPRKDEEHFILEDYIMSVNDHQSFCDYAGVRLDCINYLGEQVRKYMYEPNSNVSAKSILDCGLNDLSNEVGKLYKEIIIEPHLGRS